MTEQQKLEILPAIPPMPTPPKDSGDIQAWQKHIADIDHYISELNLAIEKIEKNNFIQNFKQKCEQLNIDIDKPQNLPKAAMEAIAQKINGILDEVREMSVELSVEESHRAHPATAIKSNRNIQSI